MARKRRSISNIFRLSNHPIVHWWWGIDRTNFVAILALMIFGVVAVSLGSSAVAKTYSVDHYYFAKKQLVFILMAIPLMASISFLSEKGVKRLGIIILLLAITGLVLTFFMGVDVKGAKRWVYIGGLSVQPTEFLKPSLTIVTALLLSTAKFDDLKRNFFISVGIIGTLAGLILLQPDFSMFLVLASVWFAQVVMSGIPFVWVFLLSTLGLGVVSGAYFLLPHVRSRVERFLDPSSGDSYQVDQARDAILSGGLLGRGPGEGVVKQHLPDAHTDFIFAVIAEEFGIIICLMLLLMFAFIIFRGFQKVAESDSSFVLLAGNGLLLLFSLQVLINMGVVLNIVPTTGMTLPFISYGGSSTISMAIIMGFVFALTRIRSKRGAKRARRR